MTDCRIVVIGASAGGVRALRRLAAALPPRFPAAVLVVLHIGSHRSTLPAILEASGPNPATHALDGEPLLPGRIYVAPPDRHLVVEDGQARLTHGAKEHHTRPTIDPLFRSAALAYGERVIGVVLTGFLDDGTAGLQAIKECGGLALVQDPADAEVPEMPLGALRHVKVDHCLPLSDLSETLVKLVNAPTPPAAARAPAALVHEHAASLGVSGMPRGISTRSAAARR